MVVRLALEGTTPLLSHLSFAPEELHFWVVHGRVTISAEPVLALNTRLPLSGPLGAKISQDPAQEESEITGRTAAHSSLQSSLRRSLPCLPSHCLPLPLPSTVIPAISPAVLSQKKVGESGRLRLQLLLSKPPRNLCSGQGCSPQVCCIPPWSLITSGSGAS